MNDTNPMVCVPRELLEEALDAAAAVGMQDVADELDRILTPSTAAHQLSSAVLWRHRDKKPGRAWNYTEHKEVAEIAIRRGQVVQGFADTCELERLAEANLHHRNLQIEADDLIKSLRAQLVELSAPAERDERAAFETSYAREFSKARGQDLTAEDIASMRDNSGGYGDRAYLNGQWAGWQARAALARNKDNSEDCSTPITQATDEPDEGTEQGEPS